MQNSTKLDALTIERIIGERVPQLLVKLWRLPLLGWTGLIDVALVVTTVLLFTQEQIVLYFHVVFMWLAVGAFFWRLRRFIWSIILWVTLTTTRLYLSVYAGVTPFEELIEIPLLVTILIIVFCIASWRAQALQRIDMLNQELDAKVENLTELSASLERARDRATASEKAKTYLMANVSHELRTPLSSIIGFVDLLQMTHANGNQQKQIHYVDRIGINAEKLLHHVNELLDQRQIELGMIQFDVHPISIDKLLDNMHAVLDVQADRKGLALTSERAAEMADRIDHDFKRLQQIVVNLANNAIKYTDGGYVRVCIRPLNEEFFAIEVEDTGRGIAENEQKTIFEPFYQIHERREARNGIGLGLSIVKRLVDLMGGEISVQSTPSKGSTFQVKLPYQIEGNEDDE